MPTLGRPTVINKKNIIKLCCFKYWEEGINKNSFNDIIKYTGVSKGSIYKLFGNEDKLKEFQ